MVKFLFLDLLENPTTTTSCPTLRRVSASCNTRTLYSTFIMSGMITFIARTKSLLSVNFRCVLHTHILTSGKDDTLFFILELIDISANFDDSSRTTVTKRSGAVEAVYGFFVCFYKSFLFSVLQKLLYLVGPHLRLFRSNSSWPALLSFFRFPS